MEEEVVYLLELLRFEKGSEGGCRSEGVERKKRKDKRFFVLRPGSEW